MTNMSDDELQQRLSGLFTEVDPVPDAVLEAGREAFGWRRIDAELAELLADSALEPELAGLARGVEATMRSVTFAAGDRTVDVELGENGAVHRLRGQLSPPAAVTVEAQRADGVIAGSAASDAFGRFLLEVSGPGTIRLRLTGEPSFEAIETAWFGL